MSISDVSKTLINHLTNIQNAANKVTARLSSGKRINSASDDAAGLAVALALESSATVSRRASMNAADGLSIADISGSTLSTVSDITARQQELAAQAANGVYSDEQRAALNQEYQQLEQEKQRQIESTQFNGMQVFNSEGTTLQVGSNGGPLSQIGMPSVNTGQISAGVADISSAENARKAVDDLQQKQETVANLQGQIGAARNRVDYAGQAAANSALESIGAASRIQDADMAQEVANNTRLSILSQAGTAMLAQANQNASMVLSLLR